MPSKLIVFLTACSHGASPETTVSDFPVPLVTRSLETQQGSVCRKMLNILASDLWKEQEFVLEAGSGSSSFSSWRSPCSFGNPVQSQHT